MDIPMYEWLKDYIEHEHIKMTKREKEGENAEAAGTDNGAVTKKRKAEADGNEESSVTPKKVKVVEVQEKEEARRVAEEAQESKEQSPSHVSQITVGQWKKNNANCAEQTGTSKNSLPPSVANATRSTTPEPRKPPTQVTASLCLTAGKPRIVLQGMPGFFKSLTKEDLASLHQSVKDQLVKAQAEAVRRNMVPPTKIVVNLPQSIQTRLPATTAGEPAAVRLPTQPLPRSALTDALAATPDPPKLPEISAQFLQDRQGLRVVVHGLKSSNLPTRDLAMIQQHAKAQLLNVRVVVDVPPEIQAKLQAMAAPDLNNNSTSADLPVTTREAMPVVGIHQAENLEIMYVCNF